MFNLIAAALVYFNTMLTRRMLVIISASVFLRLHFILCSSAPRKPLLFLLCSFVPHAPHNDNGMRQERRSRRGTVPVTSVVFNMVRDFARQCIHTFISGCSSPKCICINLLLFVLGFPSFLSAVDILQSITVPSSNSNTRSPAGCLRHGIVGKYLPPNNARRYLQIHDGAPGNIYVASLRFRILVRFGSHPASHLLLGSGECMFILPAPHHTLFGCKSLFRAHITSKSTGCLVMPDGSTAYIHTRCCHTM